MIFFNDVNRKYGKEIELCIDYINSHNMKSLPKGRIDIDGENLYLNVTEYNTKREEELSWESHRKYLDLHYIISGSEIIAVADDESLSIKEYVEDCDNIQLDALEGRRFIMKEGDFLLLDLEEAHMPGIMESSSNEVKKAIFKIKI